MNMPTAHPIRRQLTLDDQEPLRFRPELPANAARHLLEAALNATHDFLVPNLHPDLTTDSNRFYAAND